MHGDAAAVMTHVMWALVLQGLHGFEEIAGFQYSGRVSSFIFVQLQDFEITSTWQISSIYLSLSLSVSLTLYIYIYTYVFICVNIYIYIYIYISKSRTMGDIQGQITLDKSPDPYIHHLSQTQAYPV